MHEVDVVPVSQLDPALRRQMADIAARYYVRPAEGLEEELRFGDRVYFTPQGSPGTGAFLVVHMDHHRAVIEGRLHQFAYFGLGCANGEPMSPLFQRAKADLAALLEARSVGVVHLTTRTPYAIRGIERAFEVAVFPTQFEEPDRHAIEIARHLKASVHRHGPRVAGESPFVLRELKQGRFRAEEVARIRAFAGPSPLADFGIDCAGADEVIVFHRFIN